MMDFIDRLVASVPTLSQEESFEMFQSLFAESIHQDWVLYSSEIIGFQECMMLAETYTNGLSTVESSAQSFITSKPIHIFFAIAPDQTFQVHGLLYSNGAVCFIYPLGDEDKSALLFVWIDKELVNLYKGAFVDISAQRVYNTDIPTFFETFRDVE